MKHKKLSIEQHINQLEQIITRLEDNDYPLEQALQDFEHGIQLTRQAQTQLKQAEQKIETLMSAAEQTNNTGQ